MLPYDQRGASFVYLGLSVGIVIWIFLGESVLIAEVYLDD